MNWPAPVRHHGFSRFGFRGGLDGGNGKVAEVQGIMGGKGGAYAIGVSGSEEVELLQESPDAAPAGARALV